MTVKVLGISSSPRKGGNSDTLLKEALQAAEEAGAETEYVSVLDINIEPCYGCGHCDKKGVCRIKDEFPELLDKMLGADVLIFATPIYFMGVSAWGKMIIDRCQCLWSRKYVLKLDVRDNTRDWAGMVIAVGGSKSKKMFDVIDLTMKYFFDVLEINIIEKAYFNQVDEKGAVLDHPAAIEETRTKIKKLVASIKG